MLKFMSLFPFYIRHSSFDIRYSLLVPDYTGKVSVSVEIKKIKIKMHECVNLFE